MKNKFRMMIIMGILLVVVLLAGCGKKDTINQKDANEGPWFETEFHDFMLEENEFIPSFSVYGNEMYFVLIHIGESENDRLITLKRMSLDDYSIEELTTFSYNEEGMILNVFAGENGVYMTTQKMQWNKECTKLLEATYKIIICELDGTVRDKVDISDILKEKCSESEAVYLADLVCDKEGNIILTDNTSFVMAFNNAGEKIADISCDQWGNGLLMSDDGTAYYSYVKELTMQQCLVPVDIKADKFGKKIDGIKSFITYDYCIDSNGMAWFSDESTLMTCDLKTEEKTEIFDWLEYDITTESVRMLDVLEDGTMIACIEGMRQNQMVYEIAVFKESDTPLAEKQSITYATFGMDTEIMEAIVRFNKNSEDYRIKVVDYYDEENYEEAWNEFNQAVLEENFADIVNVSWSNYKMMAEKGLYADLNELMNSDGDINRAEYFENVLSAYEVNGKLYAMPVSFSVCTLAGKENIWGNKNNITYKDVKAVSDKMPEDVAIMDDMTRSECMFFMLQGSLDKFVNWETGECLFNSEEFIEILNLAKKFPKKSEEYGLSGETVDDFREDKILLYGCELADIGEYQMTKYILGEQMIALGYPGANGGLIQSSDSLFAIAEDSPNKEVAWEFVKCMISKEYQCDYIYYNNPIHKGAFDALMEDAMEKSYYEDEDGNKVENVKMSYDWDGLEIDIYAATKEEVEEYRKIVEGATNLATYDRSIMLMIEEEAEPFFENKKSAEKVAEIIQSRVEIYVNERK